MLVKQSGRARFRPILVILLIAAFCNPCRGFAAAGDAAALSNAARAGNWEAVRSLIAQGAKDDGVNGADRDGTRPLHWAVRADELEIADLLLKAGADATAQNRLGLTALYLAAANGNGTMIRKLLDHGANANQVEKSGETILMVAARSGKLLFDLEILAFRADITRISTLMLAHELNNDTFPATNIRETLPMILAGKASGTAKGGRHVRPSQLTTHSNLLLTILQKAGVRAEKIGDSKDVISEI